MAPLRKLGDEGTAMLCNVIDGGSPPEYPFIPLAALDMLIAAEWVTGTSEWAGETTCASLARDALCGYPGGILTCLVVGVLLPKNIKTRFLITSIV